MRYVTVALLALTLAACGSDDEGAEPAAKSESANFPATVTHKYGKTTVESEPKRVVTVGYTDQDPVLALGVVPLGVGDFLGGYDWRKRPWAQAALKGAEPKVVSGQEINFEAVAAQRPDLIIAVNAGLKQADYDKLSQLAPTVAQSGDYVDFGMPWDEQTLLIGKALGRTEQAEKVVADVDARFEKFRTDHPDYQGKTAIMAYGGSDGYGAYSTQDTRSRFLSDVGFKTPEAVDKLAGDSFFAEFSPEHFRLMDQDVVVMYGARDDVLANPVFRRLDAVKEDRVIYLDLTDQFAGALGFSSALSLPYLLDEGEPALTAAVDGDPKTAVRSRSRARATRSTPATQSQASATGAGAGGSPRRRGPRATGPRGPLAAGVAGHVRAARREPGLGQDVVDGVVEQGRGIEEVRVAAALARAVVLEPELGQRPEREVVARLLGLVVARDAGVQVADEDHLLLRLERALGQLLGLRLADLRVAERLQVGVDEAELALADARLDRRPAAVDRDRDPADVGLVAALEVPRARLADLHLAALADQDHVAHRQPRVEVGAEGGERAGAGGVVERRRRRATRRRTPPGRRRRGRRARARRSSARKSCSTAVAGVAPGSGLIGFAPPSDGVCLRHSATSCSPTRSALDSLISRASGIARSANFVPCSSFQTVPAPSIDCAIDGALIAGARSAPGTRCGSSP